jgi:hypothetical protein
MKKLIFALLCMAWFSSCLTVKKIEKNCDKFAKVCVTNTSTVTEYRDTTFFIKDTVYWKLPADTVTITDTVQIIDNFCQLQTVYKRFGLIHVSAGVASNILRVNAWLVDSTILLPHTDTVFLQDAIQTTNTSNTVVVEKKFIPKLYKVTFWVLIGEILLVILYLVWTKFFNRLNSKFTLTK